MKRINNKGLTVIELLVCFSIVSVIVVGLLKSVNNYSNNATYTSYKNEITTYKNTTTKYIMDKIINNDGILKSDFETVMINNNKVTLILENGNVLTIEIDANNKKIDTVYKDYLIGKKEKKSFQAPKIDNLKINPIKIENYENFIEIYADFYLTDFGHTYSALDLKIPIAEKNYSEYIKLKHALTGYVTQAMERIYHDSNYDISRTGMGQGLAGYVLSPNPFRSDSNITIQRDENEGSVIIRILVPDTADKEFDVSVYNTDIGDGTYAEVSEIIINSDNGKLLGIQKINY